jgi:molybdopterin-containing oxidoreductase family iron-sulfur binding subunit
VKTRDGRPIKVEGNALHPVSHGGVCAIGQASVLTLYDAERAQGPVSLGKPVKWRDLDRVVREGLRRLSAAGRAIRLMTPPYAGPSGEAAIARFLSAYPTARRVSHDPLGAATSIAGAHLITHGVRVIPAYRLDTARVIVSFTADFLGTWLHPVAHTRQYVSGRDSSRAPSMSRHFQLEPNYTLTGSNADVRTILAPSDVVPALAQLARRLGIDVPDWGPAQLPAPVLDRLAAELRAARGAS